MLLVNVWICLMTLYSYFLCPPFFSDGFQVILNFKAIRQETFSLCGNTAAFFPSGVHGSKCLQNLSKEKCFARPGSLFNYEQQLIFSPMVLVLFFSLSSQAIFEDPLLEHPTNSQVVRMWKGFANSSCVATFSCWRCCCVPPSSCVATFSSYFIDCVAFLLSIKERSYFSFLQFLAR